MAYHTESIAVFVVDKKVRILISKYDPDYYLLIAYAWTPKNLEIQEPVAVNYRNGNVAKLPNHEKREVIAFIAKLRIVPIEDPKNVSYTKSCEK